MKGRGLKAWAPKAQAQINNLINENATLREKLAKAEAQAKLLHDSLNQYDREFAVYRRDKNKIIDCLKMAYKLKGDRQDLADSYLEDVKKLEAKGAHR